MAEDITRSEEILAAISSPAQEIPFSSFIVSRFLTVTVFAIPAASTFPVVCQHQLKFALPQTFSEAY
jgi:hypothetical protein